MKLIVGLGNPGAKYERTRHNAGFRAVQAYAAAHRVGGRDWKEKFDSLLVEAHLGKEKIGLMLPQTFMNLSGNAAGPAAKFWKIAPEDVLCVYDDVDIPLGRIRIRADGSAGGHNGVKSMIDGLGTMSFPRIRIGVGTEKSKSMASENWVLGKFTKAEEKLLAEAIATAVDAIDEWIESGLTSAQNKFGK